jgi:hypothetical protein
MLLQLISLAGALMVLGAYFAYQRGLMGREDRWYNLLNFLGAALLTWVALADRRWGFVLLESAWAVLSLGPLLRGRRDRK